MVTVAVHDDPAVLRRTISALLLVLAPTAAPPAPADPTPLQLALDDSRRDWLPWCWDQIEAALRSGPKRPGQLCELVYGSPVTLSDRNAMSQILLRCREKRLVERIGFAWYALPGTAVAESHRQGVLADFVRLLEQRAPIGVTARQVSLQLNVPATRVHHWLMALRADPEYTKRLRTRSARMPGRGNATLVYWLERRRGRPRKPRESAS